MKKRNRIFFVLLLVTAILSSSFSIKSYADEIPTSEELKDKWYETHFYPIFYGDYLWEHAKYDLNTFYDIENPPLDLLFTMPSDELARLMMYHPHLLHVMNFWGEDGEQEYYTFFSFCESHSDIFYELLRRDDGITCLLNSYRNSGATVEWFESERATDDDIFRWYAEVAGSQFITHYAKHFSPEECELANTIIDEKNEIYSQLSSTYYFNTSHIEVNENYVKETVRTNYLTQREIEKKEKIFAEALEKMQSEEIEETPVEMEPVNETITSASTTTDVSLETDEKSNVYIIISAVAGILVVSAIFTFLIKKNKRKEV